VNGTTVIDLPENLVLTLIALSYITNDCPQILVESLCCDLLHTFAPFLLALYSYLQKMQ